MSAWIEQWLQDVRFALRMMRKNAGFTTMLLLTLGLGIGVNAVMFSVVNAVLLRPLPYKHADELVIVREKIPVFGAAAIPMPPKDIQEIQAKSHVFSESAAFEELHFDLDGAGQAERIAAARVSPSVFSLLGATPLRGRLFTQEEDIAAQPLAVISYSLWKSAFDGDESVVGKTVRLDRKPYTVIGVMPGKFQFPADSGKRDEAAQVWVPMSFTTAELAGRDWYDFELIARLKPGVSAGAAQAEVSAISAEMYAWMAKDKPELGVSAMVTPLFQEVVSNAKSVLLLLMGATLSVLLIACANIATLLLSRGSGRRREIAFRIALGATRGRLIRLSLVHDMIVAMTGGVLGTWLAWWATRFIAMEFPASIPRTAEIGMDAQVVGFAILLTLVTGILFGGIPAVSLTRVSLNDALKESSRTSLSSATAKRTRSVLICGQVALTVVLLIAASLLLDSLLRVERTDPGFRAENLVTMSVNLSPTGYAKGAHVSAFYMEALERIHRLPGVTDVTAATSVPMSGGWKRTFTAEGHQTPAGEKMQLIANTAVMDDYFDVLGVPLRAGRFFSAADGRSTVPVAIISEDMARQYWPGESAVGKRMRFSETLPWMTIVGVVGDVKQGPLDKATIPHSYQPYLQLGNDGIEAVGRNMHLILKARSDPATIVGGVRGVVQSLDPQQPIAHIETMQEIVNTSLVPRRFNTSAFLGFAMAGLLLAAVGIYGTVAYSVRQRESEIGLRMALGAQRSQILRLMSMEGVRLAAIGVVIGLPVAYGVSRLLTSLLYGVSATDPLTYAIATSLLLVMAAAASYVPARRATQVEPMTALRNE